MPRKAHYRLALELLEPRLALNSYFVSPGVNDNNPGTNASPWQTLQHAADQVAAGDTVTVRAGTYAGFVLGWDFPQNGTAFTPPTADAHAGDGAAGRIFDLEAFHDDVAGAFEINAWLTIAARKSRPGRI